MMKRRHRVEQMGEHGGAGVQAGDGLRVAGVGMADRDDDVASDEATDRVERTIEFGSQRDEAQGPECERAFEWLALRQQIERRMSPAPRGRDERTLEMHPENRGAARLPAAALRR